MSHENVDGQNRHESPNSSQTITLSDRARRALSECMTVVPDVGVARGESHLYRVVGQNGSTYTVDTDERACTCPDFEYNLSDGEKCKHLHRVAFATGARSIPDSADVSVDPLLGCALDDASSCSATTVAADGGVVPAEETDHAEVVDDDGDVWSGPHTEYDRYGEPTGYEYVRCRHCGVEVLDGEERADVHVDGCPVLSND